MPIPMTNYSFSGGGVIMIGVRKFATSILRTRYLSQKLIGDPKGFLCCKAGAEV
jgi:hypothetical protein